MCELCMHRDWKSQRAGIDRLSKQTVQMELLVGIVGLFGGWFIFTES